MKPLISKHRPPSDGTRSALGFSMIVVVLVISTLAFLIASQATLMNVQEEQTRLPNLRGRETFYLADGCLEEALLSLKQDPNYTGSTFVIGSATCAVTVASGEDTRTLTLRTTNGDYGREFQATIRLSPDFSVLRFRELPLALH